MIGIDKEYIDPIEGAHLLPYSDITERKTLDKISQILNERKAHAVVSDMVLFSWFYVCFQILAT